MYYREGKLYFESHLWKDYSGSGHYHLPDYPYEMVLNLKTGIATTNRMNFPPYLSNKKYSYQFSICRLPHKDSNIVSLTSSGNIFLNKNTVIGGKSKYQKSGYIEPAWNSDIGWPSPDSSWYYFLHTDYYSKLVYSPQSKFYFRYYRHKLPKMQADGYYSTMEDDVYSVQVFNQDFSLVHEEILKGIHFIYLIVPYKEGFVINFNTQRSDQSKHQYLYYEIKKN